MSVEITAVEPNTPADRAGIKAGDKLVSINGNPIKDVLDYGFYAACGEALLRVSDERGERELSVKKGEYEDLGLEFADFLMDSERSCANECIFCFIDQLPHGLRDTLYFKDDDARLSYLFGNYLTLTNMADSELERIVKMRITPINISVQATEPELRCMMLRNRRAGELMRQMRFLAEHGIEMNCQIVLCRDINDAERLDRTLCDLTALWPAVTSVAVVPVGLSDHREGLYPLKPFDADSAAALIDQVDGWNRRLSPKTGGNLIYAADEWYLLSGRKFPGPEYYGEYLQLENGIGMSTLMSSQFANALSERRRDRKKRACDIACGLAAEKLMRSLAKEAMNRFPGLEVRVHPIINRFFGERITVSGLVTATDIIEQLPREKMAGDTLRFTESMLRAEGDMFLDSITLDELEQKLGARCAPVANTGEALLCAMLSEDI